MTLFAVFKVYPYKVGDWSNGMIGVSKTFGGSSILSSPVKQRTRITIYEFFFVTNKVSQCDCAPPQKVV